MKTPNVREELKLHGEQMTLLSRFRETLLVVAELHTGVPRASDSDVAYWHTLLVLGYQEELQELARWLLDNQEML